MITARKIVQEIQPYPAPAEGRYGAVRLDFNENTSGFPEAYPAGIEPATISAYPEYGRLISKAATVFGVPEDSLLATNGSDEALQLIALTFVEPGERAVLSNPCFAVMPQCLKLSGAKIEQVQVREDLSFDLQGIEERLPDAKIAMFASPENPTGAVIPTESIQRWCKSFPQTLFVIDEAYGEYYGQSVVNDVLSAPNLLVLKTFSKAWAMAGLRLGLLFGNARLIDFVKRIKLPYSVNAAAVVTASRLMDDPEKVYRAARKTMERKGFIEGVLRERGYTVIGGYANSFLLQLRPSDVTRLEQFARSRGILVRCRGEQFLRVSMGTEAEMELFLDTLTEFEKCGVLKS